MFARFKGFKSTIHGIEKIADNTNAQSLAPIADSVSGSVVDASCNTTVTITCLKELYNAVGYKSSATNGNQIGITGYLEQFANIEDLQLFYADQRPDALKSSFKFVSVNGAFFSNLHARTIQLMMTLIGGINSQNVSLAGDEADLDTQFAFGLTFPTPSTFFSTAGEPPFIPDIGTPTDTNEPYTDVCLSLLRSYYHY